MILSFNDSCYVQTGVLIVFDEIETNNGNNMRGKEKITQKQIIELIWCICVL